MGEGEETCLTSPGHPGVIADVTAGFEPSTSLPGPRISRMSAGGPEGSWTL